ncbi:MAG: hypothetical protein RR063_06815 [Anaerovoracaceae bacterium]
MNFSEYALGLYPYCSAGIGEAQYFSEMIGNFVQDAAMDACQALKKQPDTRYRYIKGTRKIQPKDAKYIYDHRDINKFSSWISNQMDDSDSYDAVTKWLISKEIAHQYTDDACAELLEQILLDVIRGTAASTPSLDTESDIKLIEEIKEKIKSLPRPVDVPVPEEATSDERIYIEELYQAYGDAENLDTFSADKLLLYPDYAEDVDERRVDFYAAVTIQRGVLELGNGGLSDQFEVLKKETLDGVKDTAKRRHLNGYECMLAVMEQAVALPVTNYILSESPYWISGKIKKGVCHHLVNDKKIKWVRKKHE